MIRIVDGGLSPECWDRYVSGSKKAAFSHLHSWVGTVEAAYGHEGHAFAALRGEEVVGVLPAVLLKSRLFGRRLVSMPFLDDGGPLAESPEVSCALMNAMREVARKEVAACDLRAVTPLETDWPVASGKVSMCMPLVPDPESMLKTLPATRRNRIRKARKNGLAARFAGLEALDAFYGVFCRNMRDLGSPVHAKRFFAEILSRFPAHTGLILVETAQGKALGAGLYFRFGRTMSLPWVSSLRDTFELYPNILLYWELIAKACNEGCDTFNFGRSSEDSGTYEFKRQWGAEPEPLYWYAWSDGPGRGLESSLRADSAKREGLTRLWSRLPLSVANRAGPWLRKSISL